ncbi:PREDICTED: transcription factor E2F8 [Tinamus guttatus]|uniref:transcription factor E2F8 n=1 Tax=Tinamus guttatus TaxID=94827 RepID=UPI00052E9113|nr:PREDICTED: transcription factor E2F8 [Tinamus guttatus]
MVSRLAKNRYAWHGRHNLTKTLQTLKKVGEENKYTQQIEMLKKREYEHEFDTDGEGNEEMARSFGSVEHSEMCFVELPGMEFRAASVNSRKDKSLRVMSQKFVMLFLVSTPKIVSLEVAAKILIGEDQFEDLGKSKFKTKIRRLYDIANVLSSLELIKKVHVTEERGRKPAFKWTGPEVLSNARDTKLEATSATWVPHISKSITSKEQCSKNLFPSRVKQTFTRHPSLIKLVKSIENDRRKIQSAPTSPVKISASSDENLSTVPSKMAQLAAISKHHLEGQAKSAEETPGQWALGCAPRSPPLAPVLLPPAQAGVSYALYLHPPQAPAGPTYSPSLVLQPLPCSNAPGSKSIDSKGPNGPTTAGGEDHVAKEEPRSVLAATDRPAGQPETVSHKCLKRSQALEENSLIKRCRSDDKSPDTPLGESLKVEKLPSNGLQVKHETDTSQKERQNKVEKSDQNVAGCCDQCKREAIPEEEDRTKAKQEIPLTFATPAPETSFPSRYLIPFPQCIHHGTKAGFCNKEKAGMCLLQHATYGSPIAGVIPVTAPELKTVNIPVFHITPLNIMLSPTSLAAAPVLSNSCIISSTTSSAQAPGSSVLNFTLQQLGLIPAGVHVPANPVLQHLTISSNPESVSHSSENINLKDEKPSGPKEPQELHAVKENFFRTPGGPNTVSSFSANSDGTDAISQGTLYIPQRKLEVAED